MARVLVIPDTHCPAMKEGFVSFLRASKKKHKTNRVVHIGDLVDWAAISYHEKPTELMDAEREYANAKKQVKEIVKAFPEADWLIGNHDCLTKRKCSTAGIPISALRDYNDLWGLDWTVHERYESVEIDGVLYSHGETGAQGKYAALNQAKENFQSTVIGHLHSQAGVWLWANPRNLVFGMCVGCGVDRHSLAMQYGRKFKAKPILGCGVVIEGEQAIFEPWIL